jgi:hypothetical protein
MSLGSSSGLFGSGQMKIVKVSGLVGGKSTMISPGFRVGAKKNLLLRVMTN